MRKIIALLVTAAAFTTMVSCGRTVSRLSADVSVPAQEIQESSGMSFREKVKQPENTEIQAVTEQSGETEEAPVGYIEDSEIAEPIRQTINAVSQPQTMMSRLFPAALVSAAEGAGAVDYMLRYAGVSPDGGDAYDMSGVLIRDERSAEPAEIELAEKIFSAYVSAFGLLNSNGITLEMMQNRGGSVMDGIAAQLDSILAPDSIRRSSGGSVHISEMKYVTVESGGAVSVVPMYKPEGEDWKVGAFLLSFK